jgi:hypothetical protein
LLRGQKTQYAIKAKQLGAGDPSPDNVRPILPGLRLTRDDSSTLEVYGGTLDVTSGVLTVSMARYLLGQSAEDWRWDRSNNYYYLANTETILAGRKRAGSLLCSIAVKYPATTVAEFRDAPAWNILFVGNMNIRPDEEVGALGTGAKFREWLASREEAVEVVYELEAPVTYQLTQTEVERAVRELRR